MFVYSTYWDRDAKVQSSWSHWNFPTDTMILSAHFIESVLWLTLLHDGVVTMESMDLSPGAMSRGVPHLIHLDRQITQDDVSLTYDPVRDETIINMPYPPTRDLRIVAQQGNPTTANLRPGRQLFRGYVEGEQVEYRIDRGKVIVPYKLDYFWLGMPYQMTYQFSTFYMRQPTPGGDMAAVVSGRLQMRRMSLAYADSGYFRVEVVPTGRPIQTYLMTAKTVGERGTAVGRNQVVSGSFVFPILSQNTHVTVRLENDSVMPSTILSAEWEAEYNPRARRI